MSDEHPDDPADEPDDDAVEPEEPEDERVRRPRPAAGPSVSPAAQVATVAGAVIVLIVVALVFVLQDGKETPRPPEAVTPGGTVVPEEPPTGYEPSRNEALPPLPSFAASLCPSLTIEHPFTVLSFNIHSGVRKGGGLQIARIIAEIRAWKADVVLLQESDYRRARSGNVIQAQQIAEALDMSWVAAPMKPTGNAILSRYPVKSKQIIALPKAGGRFDRTAVHAVLDIAGTEVSAYSTHFEHTSSSARVAQARALAKVLTADQRPKVVGGDLNSRPASAAVGILRGAGLGDSWAVGTGNGFTHSSRNPRLRIDYVLHDGLLEPVQSAVLASAVSDHRAVWTRLQLREDLGCIKIGA